MALKGNTQEEQIWNFLRGKIDNDYGVAGLMGNLYAESRLNPKNLENLCEIRLKEAGKAYCTDAAYTTAVDNGKISREEFLYPLPCKQYGYGLAQWTSAGRKAGLYDLAKSKGVSIGDLETQLEFLVGELSVKYKGVLSVIKTATSVKTASDKVLIGFECPKDRSEMVKTKRAGYGQDYYDKYSENRVIADQNGGNRVSVKIGHASIDERGRISGGEAGDQTGREVCTREWYNKPWAAVIRPKDSSVAEKIARAMEDACANNNIGYDQLQRTTLYTQAKAKNWIISAITTECECDCSSLVAVCVNAAGIAVSKDIYTGNEKSALQATGKFIVYTESKYVRTSDYLKRGDILLAKGHTAIVLSDGVQVAAVNNNDGSKMSVEEIAREVSDGKWGNGSDRKKRLEAAGYNYLQVQAAVNKICKSR